ncbi:MAG: hypothetical protein J7J65_05590 [Candidatus Korarchaeota archaeon]|nr:hypothetical protein [Candidatus Korarchaeota archaeon]
MPLGVREERTFRRSFNRHLRTLEEMSIENPEDLAAILAVAEIMTVTGKSRIRAREIR